MRSGDAAHPPAKRAIRRLRSLAPLAGLILFAAAVYLSGRLAVEMVRNRLPDRGLRGDAPLSGETLIVGNLDDPLYLARSPDSLRRFFAAHPTPEDRAVADLTGLGIRRVRDTIQVATQRIEADAIEVRITTGSLAGTDLWIHHSQVRSNSPLDPVVSPVPLEGQH